jgi:hypothetical protein
MNKFLSLVLLIFIFISPSITASGSSEDLISQINELWKQKKHSEIKELLNTRLSSNEDDAIAIGIMQYYYFFVEANYLKAREYSDRFILLVDQSNNEAAKNMSKTLRDDIFSVDINSNNGQPYTENQLESIHNCFSNTFPGIETIKAIVNKI